ncbi:MAG: CarD family transcriptional regulator [Oscillibacter sp.]|nr:CarD family transcriptional regulator [Oscillibacter sp.]
MFCVGDKVAHPMHGAGVIDEIVTETVAGAQQDYYVFRMPVGGLTLKIPTAAGETSGLRGIWELKRIEQLLRDLSGLEVERFTGSWNQRYRENMQKLKSGDLYEVARVIKGLIHRESERGLSTGERKMLRTAKQILISEMVLSTGEAYGDLEQQVNSAVAGGVKG